MFPHTLKISANRHYHGIAKEINCLKILKICLHTIPQHSQTSPYPFPFCSFTCRPSLNLEAETDRVNMRKLCWRRKLGRVLKQDIDCKSISMIWLAPVVCIFFNTRKRFCKYLQLRRSI
jgi:hypothetical protein